MSQKKNRKIGLLVIACHQFCQKPMRYWGSPHNVVKLFVYFRILLIMSHTTYSRNNMGQKCEGNCGLWVLDEMI